MYNAKSDSNVNYSPGVIMIKLSSGVVTSVLHVLGVDSDGVSSLTVASVLRVYNVDSGGCCAAVGKKLKVV